MDLQYGIAVTNKFALFINEDEDPLEAIRQKAEEAKSQKKESGDKKTKTKQSKKTPVVESKPKPVEQPLPKKDEKVTQPRVNERGGGRGGGRGRELRENDGSRPPRRQGPRENREFKGGDENVPPEFSARPDSSLRRERGEGGFERGRGRGGRGRGRGRGGFGGPRPESARGGGSGGSGGGGSGGGGFGVPNDRRREFDRHSSTDKTGIKPIDKREGAGAHNWGSYKDDLEDQAQPQNPADESGEWAASPVENAETPEQPEAGEGDAVVREEEAKEMTLDEWKALQEAKRVKAHFNIRKAGEGVDNAQFKRGVAYQKKHESGEEEEEEESEEEEEEDRHGHRKQIVTDIRITFADNPRRGGRGGRRGGRAPGGRGGPRGQGRGLGGSERGSRSSREAAPRIDDDADFPRLVKSEA